VARRTVVAPRTFRRVQRRKPQGLKLTASRVVTRTPHHPVPYQGCRFQAPLWTLPPTHTPPGGSPSGPSAAVPSTFLQPRGDGASTPPQTPSTTFFDNALTVGELPPPQTPLLMVVLYVRVPTQARLVLSGERRQARMCPLIRFPIILGNSNIPGLALSFR